MFRKKKVLSLKEFAFPFIVNDTRPSVAVIRDFKFNVDTDKCSFTYIIVDNNLEELTLPDSQKAEFNNLVMETFRDYLRGEYGSES